MDLFGFRVYPLVNKNMYITSFFSDMDDVIFRYIEEEAINKPISEEEKSSSKPEIYETIQKYTFYEYDDDWVRYYIMKEINKLMKKIIYLQSNS